MIVFLNVFVCCVDGVGKFVYSDVFGWFEFIVNFFLSGVFVEFDNWRFIMLFVKWNNLDVGDIRGDFDSLVMLCWSIGCGELWRILDFYWIIVYFVILNFFYLGS